MVRKPLQMIQPIWAKPRRGSQKLLLQRSLQILLRLVCSLPRAVVFLCAIVLLSKPGVKGCPAQLLRIQVQVGQGRR